MKIRFVTSNTGKIAEARARLGPLGFDVVGVRRDLEEIQADAIEDVARHKAQQLVGRVSAPFFVEDAGLHVDALHQFPASYSSFVFRTLGCDGILRLLDGHSGAARRAHFLAVIAFVDPTRRVRLFRGRADGHIAIEKRGTDGFGFDPIFVPEGSEHTFAELSPEEKGTVSHRGRALDALVRHLASRRRSVSGKKP